MTARLVPETSQILCNIFSPSGNGLQIPLVWAWLPLELTSLSPPPPPPEPVRIIRSMQESSTAPYAPAANYLPMIHSGSFRSSGVSCWFLGDLLECPGPCILRCFLGCLLVVCLLVVSVALVVMLVPVIVMVVVVLFQYYAGTIPQQVLLFPCYKLQTIAHTSTWG